MTKEHTPTEAQQSGMSIETMRTMLKISSYATPGHGEAKEGLELCAKELPMNETDYGRALVIRNILVEKRPIMIHFIGRGAAKPIEIEVMDNIIEMLNYQTAQTRIMNPQIATLRVVRVALRGK